jgi:surfeit locus 1 family protein
VTSLTRHRRFKPSPFGTVLVLAGVALGVRLGLWQIDRAAEKNALIAQFEQGQTTVVELSNADIGTLPRYQRVHFSGRYDARHQILLDNMPSQGQPMPGFRVLTPLELASGGGWVLVDRGWLPMKATRTDLPALEVAEDVREITGRVDELPEPGVRLGNQTIGDSAANWPRVLNYPRKSDLERMLGRPLPARIVRLDASQPDGYERNWNPSQSFGSQRHIGYAVQWFAMAAAMVVVYLVVSFKRVQAHGDDEH